MRVLIADKLPPHVATALEELGLEADVRPELGSDDLPGAMKGTGALIVRSTGVTKEALTQADALQLIVRAGAGVNTIDVEAASHRGIFVANCPGKNAVAVAELALGLMLCSDRHIHLADADLRAGRWKKKTYASADGIKGKTLGVIGCGQIGTEVITRAKAFGMPVVAWSRSLDSKRARELGVMRCANVSEVAERSDVVSVHLARTEETRGLLGAEFFAAMKPNATLINTARDGIVDESALLRALDEKNLRYGADVFDGEPSSGEASFESPLLGHRHTVFTPHVGASTQQAQNAVADEAVRIISEFVQSGTIPNCVNLCEKSPAKFQLNVRHFDKVGVLAGVLSSLREAGINVDDMENVLFEGAPTRCARIRLSSAPNNELLSTLGAQEHVIDAQLVQL